MQWKQVVGVLSGEEAEICLLAGYNGTGAELNIGSPVCWDAVASDGRTFVLPTTTGFNNFRLFAGIVDATVGTADYTAKIVAYGPVSARTYGVAATFIPGCCLWLVADKDYVAYGTESVPIQAGKSQPIALTALETHATTSAERTKVFVRAL